MCKSDDSSKTALLASVIAEVALRGQLGDCVDDQEIIAAHPELMPELAHQLVDLHRIERVVSDVPQPPVEDQIDTHLRHASYLNDVLDNYEVLEPLDRGGQGYVFRALQRGTRREVALKVLTDGPLATTRRLRRFEREIEITSRLNHPNIVTVYDSGVIDGKYYFAMELIDGVPIDDYVILNDLSPREIVVLFILVTRAVAFAHQNGIIHRDLHPGNILVDIDGQPHICDFGLAKEADTSKTGRRRFTQDGQVVGVLPYLSPEQASGRVDDVDTRSDVYSLGVILYKLLSDGYPYPVDGDAITVRDRILHSEAIPLRRSCRAGQPDRMMMPQQVTRDLEAVVGNALLKNPDERYQLAAALADDLQCYLDGVAVHARASSGIYVLRRTLWRYRLGVGFAALLLIIVSVAAVLTAMAWSRALRERDDAREATRVAMNWLDSSLAIDEEIRTLAGSTAVRDRLLRRIGEHLPRLEVLLTKDQLLAPGLVRLLELKGDLAAEEGRVDEAQQYYTTFLQRVTELVDHDSSDCGMSNALTRAYRKLAKVIDDPWLMLHEGIDHATRTFETHPECEDAKYELVKTHLDMATCLTTRFHKYVEGLNHSEQAIAIAGPLDDGTPLTMLQTIAKSHAERATCLINLGHGEQSLTALRKAMEMREQVLEMVPANTSARIELLRSYQNLGYRQSHMQQPEAALSSWQKALSLAELLCALDPTVFKWKTELMISHARLASSYLVSGDLTQAAQYSDTASLIADEMRMMAGNSYESLHWQAWVKLIAARIAHTEGDDSRASQIAEEALGLRIQALARNRQNAAAIQGVAKAHDWLAYYASRPDQINVKLAHYYRSHRLWQELSDQYPNDVDFALDMIRSHSNLAATLTAMRLSAYGILAQSHLQQAHDLMTNLDRSGMLTGHEMRVSNLLTAIDENIHNVQPIIAFPHY